VRSARLQYRARGVVWSLDNRDHPGPLADEQCIAKDVVSGKVRSVITVCVPLTEIERREAGSSRWSVLQSGRIGSEGWPPLPERRTATRLIGPVERDAKLRSNVGHAPVGRGKCLRVRIHLRGNRTRQGLGNPRERGSGCSRCRRMEYRRSALVRHDQEIDAILQARLSRYRRKFAGRKSVTMPRRSSVPVTEKLGAPEPPGTTVTFDTSSSSGSSEDSGGRYVVRLDSNDEHGSRVGGPGHELRRHRSDGGVSTFDTVDGPLLDQAGGFEVGGATLS